ncbi:MAG: 60 kDa SS-A/Ro ribonucleoprotein [Thermomicrobiales bacterium]|jgi:hypothetical protein|nr:60 kDa SS-A/Ro ribonucleoprotein [Thermomicrobiales bacterium]
MRAGQVRTHEGGVAFAVDQWTHLRRFLILGSAIGTWYGAKSLDDLAYWALKYLQRDGWTHADLLQLAHPRAMDAGRNALYRWIVDGDLLPELAEAAATAHAQLAAFAELAILPEATHAPPSTAGSSTRPISSPRIRSWATSVTGQGHSVSRSASKPVVASRYSRNASPSTSEGFHPPSPLSTVASTLPHVRSTVPHVLAMRPEMARPQWCATNHPSS